MLFSLPIRASLHIVGVSAWWWIQVSSSDVARDKSGSHPLLTSQLWIGAYQGQHVTRRWSSLGMQRNRAHEGLDSRLRIKKTPTAAVERWVRGFSSAARAPTENYNTGKYCVKRGVLLIARNRFEIEDQLKPLARRSFGDGVTNWNARSALWPIKKDAGPRYAAGQ